MNPRPGARWVGVRNRATGEQMTVRGYHLVDALRPWFPGAGQGDPVEHAALMSALNDLAANLSDLASGARIAADLDLHLRGRPWRPAGRRQRSHVRTARLHPQIMRALVGASTPWNAADT